MSQKPGGVFDSGGKADFSFLFAREKQGFGSGVSSEVGFGFGWWFRVGINA